MGIGYRNGPAGASDTPEPGPQKGLVTVDTNRVPQPRHDDTVEAHYACLERLGACLEGWVFSPSRTSMARREKPPTAVGGATLASGAGEQVAPVHGEAHEHRARTTSANIPIGWTIHERGEAKLAF